MPPTIGGSSETAVDGDGTTQEELKMAKKKKIRVMEAWMRDHPDDVPCPKSPDAARAWRHARGLDKDSQIAFLRSRIGAATDPWVQAQISKLESK
jgi:hypothetical protein